MDIFIGMEYGGSTILYRQRNRSDTSRIDDTCTLRPCLVPEKFCKIFQIFRHIESLDAYMEY